MDFTGIFDLLSKAQNELSIKLASRTMYFILYILRS